MEEETPAKDNSTRNFIILAAAIVIVLLALILLYRHYSSKPMEPVIKTYNGYTFEKIGALWYTEVQSGNELYQVPLHYAPDELENVTVSGSAVEFAAKEEFYITFDPKAAPEDMAYIYLVSVNIETNLMNFFGRKPKMACIVQDDSACKELPILTCANTTEPIIELNAIGRAQVLLNKNCVTLYGKKENLIMASDRFILKYYGIMP
jgi:hypothetical protein